MRSDEIKQGMARAPHRALLKALGLTNKEIAKPFIGIANSYTTIVPGHIHLRTIAEAVKEGISNAGGTSFEFNTIAVCDGIAMGHEGMRYSLPSRELIADSVEIMVQAHRLDGIVLIFQLRQSNTRHAHGCSATRYSSDIHYRRRNGIRET